MKNHYERDGQTRLRNKLEADNWYVRKLHGSKFQANLPDLICFHSVHGVIFIECKIPGAKLTPGQMFEFHRMHKFGAKIFVLHDEKDFGLLFKGGQLAAPNWINYACRPTNNTLPSRFSTQSRLGKRR